MKAKQVYDKMMEKDFFSQWMGVELVTIEEGTCILRMQVKKEMLNGFGILHGGVSFAFADSAFAFASNSYGRLSVSMNANMTYSKQAREGDTLIAKATELVKGNKSGTYDVEVTNQNSGEVVALFRGTVYRTSSEVK